MYVPIITGGYRSSNAPSPRMAHSSDIGRVLTDTRSDIRVCILIGSWKWKDSSADSGKSRIPAANGLASAWINHNGNDRICSFVFFGFQKTTEAEGSGFYIIGYIARALGAKGCHFGDFTLRYALNVCKEDSLKRGIADPLIFALIDHRNKESLALFERNGFLDDGPDEDEPDRYRRFVRFGFGGQEAPRSNT